MILNKRRIENAFAKAEKIFKIIIEFINYGFIKKDNRFFFTSYPDFSDSPHSLWKYLDSSEKKIEIVWSVNDSVLFQNKNYRNTIFVTRFSVMYFISIYNV